MLFPDGKITIQEFIYELLFKAQHVFFRAPKALHTSLITAGSAALQARLSVFFDRFEPPSEGEVSFTDASEQIGPQFLSVALLKDLQIEWRGACKKQHVLEVAIVIALQLAESDIVGIHHEEMDVLEDSFIDWSEPLLVLVRDLCNANEVQVHAMLSS